MKAIIGGNMPENTWPMPDREFIGWRRWGSDHWSTLMYLEFVAVDNKHTIQHVKMRADPDVHPQLCHSPSFGDKKYPTRLRVGTERNHDDWSCAEDMIAEGLLVLVREDFYNTNVYLTAKGWYLAGIARRLKANNMPYNDFSAYLEDKGNMWVHEERL